MSNSNNLFNVENDQDIVKYYNLAKDCFKNTNYPEAIKHLDTLLLTSNSKSPEIYLLKCECYINLKDYNTALTIINDGLMAIHTQDSNSNPNPKVNTTNTTNNNNDNDNKADYEDHHEYNPYSNNNDNKAYYIKLLYKRYGIYTLMKMDDKANVDIMQLKKIIKQGYNVDIGRSVNNNGNDSISASGDAGNGGGSASANGNQRRGRGSGDGLGGSSTTDDDDDEDNEQIQGEQRELIGNLNQFIEQINTKLNHMNNNDYFNPNNNPVIDQNHHYQQQQQQQSLSKNSRKKPIRPPQQAQQQAQQQGNMNQREIESKKVWELLQSAKQANLFAKEHTIVHLISMKWFNKWKNYTNFQRFFQENYDLNLDDNDNGEDCTTNHNGKGNDNANDIVKETKYEYPGPIEQDDILDNTIEDLLTDPDRIREYCNCNVKLGLIENKDFIIVSNLVWKYLHSNYGGKDIKRYVVSINDDYKNHTMVEIWLKKINLIVFPLLYPNKNNENIKNQIKTLYLSKKETIDDLKEKILRIYQTYHNTYKAASIKHGRIWKLDPRSDYKFIIQNFYMNTLKINDNDKNDPDSNIIIIKGKRLEESLVLEDAELSDNDIIVFEYKINDQWHLKSEQEYNEDLQNRCGYCKKSEYEFKNGKHNHQQLLYCQCMTIKYCNYECQKKHRSIHRDKCNIIRSEKDKTLDVLKQFKVNKFTKFSYNSRNGITGLQNLGNTCFMNSSLQCLSNIWELTQYFLSNDFIKDLNTENKLGTGGKLAVAYATLIKELWHGTDSYVSPWDIKKIIGKVASQFCGFNQQDSQEFLCYLLDGLHEDLNRVKKKPFVESLESNNRPDEIVAMECWKNHLKRNQSVVVDLMHGQYKSKLVCPDCAKISITFDPFVTISLPIPSISFKQTTLPLYFIYKDSRKISQKIQLNISPNSSALEVIKQVSKIVEIDETAIELDLLKDFRVLESKTMKLDVRSLKMHEGMLFAFETQDIAIDGTLRSIKMESDFRFEILIKQEIKRTDDEEISFSRILYLNKDSTLKDLHLQVYFIIRNYVYNYVLVQKESLYTKYLAFNIDKTDLNTLNEEYNRLINYDQEPGIFYKLNYYTRSGYNRVKQEIPFDDEIKLHEFFEEIKGSTTFIEILFNKVIRTEILKLNKCQESTYRPTNSSKSLRNHSIYECIDMFTRPELLDKDNLWYCNVCKDHKQATKTMEMYKTPKILILHLKRFKTNRVSSIGSFYYTSSSSKITDLVEFPIKGLDLRNYVLGKYDTPPIYDLFAISNHYGGMGGGHYTAYAKNHMKDSWYDFNDSSVTRQDPNELITEAAYVLFYKRRENETIQDSNILERDDSMDNNNRSLKHDQNE